MRTAAPADETRPATLVRAAAPLEVALLGPVEARVGGAPVDLGTPRQRALLVALALSQGQAVSVDALVDLVWGAEAPPGVTATLQAYVSGLRKVLEPDRARRAPAALLTTVAPGYALRLPASASDAGRFEAAVAEEHRRLALPLLGPSPLPAPTLEASAQRLEEALGLWRGTPYVELEAAPPAVAERAHLEELRLVALEDHAFARLTLGDHAMTAARLETLTASNPLRERLWALRVLALVRSGRQAEALDVLRQVRAILGDELGIDPGAELRDLQERVLRQDPALSWVPPQGGAPVEVPEPADPSDGDLPKPPERQPLVTADAAWPMLGRDEELHHLESALRSAVAGQTSFVVVTGDPGIGKSRLCAELVGLAVKGGTRVLVGRCSQDDGAPPLWPWRTVLERLGGELPAVTEQADEGAQFRSWERITRAVREAAAEAPLLIVLDDLHWADTASLRVLRLLAETSHSDRVLVVATWRDRPKPVGDLADVAESLARRHAVRIELEGLDATAVAGVVGAVTTRRPSDAQAGELRTRTDGNPFFLIEYARLAGGEDELARLLTEEHPPTAVQEVLDRRLDRLPEPTVRALRTAAVVGREWDVPTVAAVTGTDEDDLLDVVEPAQAAGLVREDGIDRFVFSHALVRDALYAGASPSRRARIHARVAEVLAAARGRDTEVARHWSAAGPAHAAKAWRASLRAAAVASQVHAHREAVTWHLQALEAMAADPEATLRDRYDVLMGLVAAYRWAAMWTDLTQAVERAVEVAEQIGDVELVARAAISTTRGALWQPSAHGEVHREVVEALRRSLAALPTADSELRCRCMLSLASELYYAVSFEERRALADEALAMAERIGGPALLRDACQIAYLSLWVPSTATERLGLADRALEACRATGDEHGAVVCSTLKAVALGEAGRPAEMWPVAEEARAEAERLRLPYCLLVLDTLAIAWHAMAGELERSEALLAQVLERSEQVSLKHSEDAVNGAFITIARWQGRSGDLVPLLQEMQDGPFPLTATVVAFLWYAGREDEAREYAERYPIELEHDDWFSALAWCNAAEVALYLDRPQLGAAAYAKLAPLSGHAGSAGSGNACGPVDAFLAMAAAATGETELATRHADAAERQCEEWQIPLCAQWVRAQRDRYHY